MSPHVSLPAPLGSIPAPLPLSARPGLPTPVPLRRHTEAALFIQTPHINIYVLMQRSSKYKALSGISFKH